MSSKQADAHTLLLTDIPECVWSEFRASGYAGKVCGSAGARKNGTDYSQMMMVWALPGAIEGKGLKDICRRDGFVDRIIQAGKQ